MQIEVAAMLSQVGCVAVPEPLLAKQLSGTPLTHAEQLTLKSQASLGSRLVAKIPRLENVAKIIALTSRHGRSPQTVDEFDAEEEEASQDLQSVQTGAQLISLLIDFDTHCQRLSMSQAIINSKPMINTTSNCWKPSRRSSWAPCDLAWSMSKTCWKAWSWKNMS